MQERISKVPVSLLMLTNEVKGCVIITATQGKQKPGAYLGLGVWEGFSFFRFWQGSAVSPVKRSTYMLEGTRRILPERVMFASQVPAENDTRS